MRHERPLPVAGTSRKQVFMDNGTALQFQRIYLPEEAWEKLEELSRKSKTSGSMVIESLINEATKHVKKATE